MDNEPDGLIKQREIRFHNLDPQGSDADDVIALLRDVKGIEDTSKLAHDCVEIHYDLRHISLQVIEDALMEVGFQLENSLVTRLKRALLYYTEETQIVNLGYFHDQANNTLDMFIKVYNQRKHGCRDERPAHLRQYS